MSFHYTLAAKLLRKFNDREISELVHLYKIKCDELDQAWRIIEDHRKEITILENENRILKENKTE